MKPAGRWVSLSPYSFGSRPLKLALYQFIRQLMIDHLRRFMMLWSDLPNFGEGIDIMYSFKLGENSYWQVPKSLINGEGKQ